MVSAQLTWLANFIRGIADDVLRDINRSSELLLTELSLANTRRHVAK